LLQLQKTHLRSLIDVLTISTDKAAFRPLNAITIYMGSKVGWYITFLYNLAGLSAFVAILALILFVYRIYDAKNQAASIWVTIYGCFVAIWSTYVLEKWKRRQQEMRITWDLHHFEQQERQRTEYTGDFIVDDNT